jgi:predicted TIM-barrel fold metal-dependent hydrolase
MSVAMPARDADLETARREFLASGHDDLLPIVDAHHHYWDVTRNPHPWLTDLPRIAFRYGDYGPICSDYLPADYAAASGQHRVLRHVLMEGEWTPQDPTGEAVWMQQLASAHPVPHERPHAMAAQIWLDRADVGEVLHAYRQPPLAEFVRSVRHKPRCTTQHLHTPDWAEPGSMRCPLWREGYAQLEAAGLMFELQASWWHMPEAAELARDFPGIPMIVNHAGMPGARDDVTLAAWRKALRPLAAYSNVWVKISGLGVQGQPWTPEQQQPVLQALLSDFGPDRCMLASNHPVDGLVVSLSDLWSGFKQLSRCLPPDTRLAIFCDNAVSLYHLH